MTAKTEVKPKNFKEKVIAVAVCIMMLIGAVAFIVSLYMLYAYFDYCNRI